MEQFSIAYNSKSLYKDLSDIVYYFHTFSHRKNKNSIFRYYFAMFVVRYLGGLAIFTGIQIMRLAEQATSISDYIMCITFIVPGIFALILPKQCFILIFYFFFGNELKKVSIKFFESYFEMTYPHGSVHKCVYTELKKVVETEKIIKFYHGPYIIKKYLTANELEFIQCLIASKLNDKYVNLT